MWKQHQAVIERDQQAIAGHHTAQAVAVQAVQHAVHSYTSASEMSDSSDTERGAGSNTNIQPEVPAPFRDVCYSTYYVMVTSLIN